MEKMTPEGHFQAYSAKHIGVMYTVYLQVAKEAC